MQICLAAISTRNFLKDDYCKSKYLLESYYSMTPWLVPVIKSCELFMLDSGAFSFVNSVKKEVNFWDYLAGYIDFINENDIEHFFELDVDPIVGLKEVERLRDSLEERTGKPSIPVWHKSRGKNYFIEMCKKYPYVAIGGIAAKEITDKDFKYFNWFIQTAHDYGCRIHGLGFTNIAGLYEYPFDSVDSTTWTAGGRYGAYFHFNGRRITRQDGHRIEGLSTDYLDRHNFYEWVKFQKYAEEKL